MIFAPYCYEESKTSDDENCLHVDRVEEDDDTEIFDPLNQFMWPFTLKLKNRSGYIQNAWNH
jgi:hypothetical protein